MEVSIYKDVPVKEEEREFKLKLFRFPDRVVLALADENGERINSSSLISVTDSMEIVRCASIRGDLGIPLVGRSRLKIVGEDD